MLKARLLKLLAIVAMLLAPFGMMGGGSAMAMPLAASMPTTAHCEGMMQPSEGQPQPEVDCMIACAAIPATGGGEISAPMMFAAPIEPEAPIAIASGLGPEAATPPPRFS